MDVEWLKARKKERKITDVVLAEALGVERSVANKIANGKVAMNVRRADALAALLGTTRDEVLFRAGLAAETKPTTAVVAVEDDAIDMVGIQHIDLAYGMGATFVDDHVDVEVLNFPKVWVETITYSPPALLTWTRGRGDSMTPTIYDGDLIMIDRSQKRVIEQDAIWAFLVGDVGSIKRLRVKGDRYVILSDNPAVPDDEEPQDFVRIVGRVVFVGARK